MINSEYFTYIYKVYLKLWILKYSKLSLKIKSINISLKKIYKYFTFNVYLYAVIFVNAFIVTFMNQAFLEYLYLKIIYNIY